jgi:hypothetical protein
MRTSDRTLLNTMNSCVTYEATTSTEEEVGIIGRETRKSIKSETVDSHGDRSREYRALVESNPVGMMVIRHWKLWNPSLFPFLYTCDSVTDEYLLTHHQTKERTNGIKKMNMGLKNTIGEGAEHPGISLSQIQIIRSLSKSHCQDTFTQWITTPTELVHYKSYEGPPM